ncbi:hypothetical protein [Planobispora longispora]|uniref:Uncharacterized protein n=1 Tax=Planobispora longispora TaxID=28887 RepID=A0A8J3RJ51_9ACTN|nr:hypothetical protein [Planobispora longispora]BFE85221.1 hypothetical protein GCM10020093_078220 [Planobispora longispora]GIH75126.1 hypothetical protein Plo01_15550 [Planobispora longispora]
MTLQELAARYPDWVIWRGATENGPGSWYATRRGTSLSTAQFNAGMAQTVSGDNAAALGAGLQRQCEIACGLIEDER